MFTLVPQAIICRTCQAAIAECQGSRPQSEERGGQASGMSVQASARAQCQIGRSLDGETRGQNVPDHGCGPVFRCVDQRPLILKEQLPALLCVLGLAGRLGLRDAGSRTSRGAYDSRGSLEFQYTGRVPQEFAGCRINAIKFHPSDMPFQISSAKGYGVQFGRSQALSEFRSIQPRIWAREHEVSYQICLKQPGANFRRDKDRTTHTAP